MAFKLLIVFSSCACPSSQLTAILHLFAALPHFRLPELDSVADLLGVHLTYDKDADLSVCL